MTPVSAVYAARMRANLLATTRELEACFPGRWCIAYGTLLGWYRGRKFVPGDADCDTLLWDFDRWSDALTAFGAPEGLSVTLNGNAHLQVRTAENAGHGGHCDIFPARRGRNETVALCYAHQPRSPYHYAPAIRRTFWSEIEGVRVRVPENFMDLLAGWYPRHQYKNHDTPRGRVMVNMCADLFHAGHLDTLQLANFHGRVVVALHSDESIAERKGRPPVIPMRQRAAMLRGCVWVDEVILDAPWDFPAEFLDKHDCTHIVHAGPSPNTTYAPGRLIDPHNPPIVHTTAIRDAVCAGRTVA